MKDLVMQQVKEAYTAIHAPESLIRTVISRIGQAQRDDQTAEKSIPTFAKKEKIKPTKT